MVIVGIDGGLTGAVTFLYVDGRVAIDDLPTVDLPGEGMVRRRVHGPSLSKLLTTRCAGEGAVRAYIEALATGGFGKQRGQEATVNSQHRTRGVIECTFEIRGIALEDVTPKRWKGMYGLKGGHENKGESIEIARKLYPELVESYLSRQKDHNRAESLLIAHFARKALA